VQSPLEDEFDRRLRREAVEWLDRGTKQGSCFVTRAELSGFTLDGKRIALVDPQQGIHKPQGLSAVLSILTTYTWPGRQAPYNDLPGDDGMMRYKWRGVALTIARLVAVAGDDGVVDEWDDPLELRIRLGMALERIAALEGELAELRGA
jgi:hypothetical protein